MITLPSHSCLHAAARGTGQTETRPPPPLLITPWPPFSGEHPQSAPTAHTHLPSKLTFAEFPQHPLPTCRMPWTWPAPFPRQDMTHMCTFPAGHTFPSACGSQPPATWPLITALTLKLGWVSWVAPHGKGSSTKAGQGWSDTVPCVQDRAGHRISDHQALCSGLAARMTSRASLSPVPQQGGMRGWRAFASAPKVIHAF